MIDVQSDIAFSAEGISKSFPGVKALSDVSFDLKVGQVHAIVGENGAGKTTLVKIIAGLQPPDSGQMIIKGNSYTPSGRKDAERRGIRMVRQELNLINNLTVAENIFLENLPSKFGFVDYPRLNTKAKQLTEQIGLSVDVSAKITELGIGQQQMVEIAAGLSQNCDILILDEPTASLTDKETELLLAQIEKLKADGVSKNISLTKLPQLCKFSMVSESKEKQIAAEFVDKLSIKSSSTEQAVGNLSGGNQQKVVIAKWLYRDCEIMIFDEPTRGIDVGAKFEIYQMLDELAKQGKAIIVVSSDLKELMAISDRIAVMSDGKMAGEFSGTDWSQEKIAAAAFSEYVN